ncbi:ATP-binding cassette domain-containing protein [Lachnospiraceae bacterium 54-53]
MAIAVRNLTKEYTRGGAVFQAVAGVDLTVGRGDFVSIIGRSGSVETDGENIARLDDRASSIYRNSKIGYIPQGQSALAGLSVLDNVRLPFHLFQNHGDSAALAMERFKQTGVSCLADSYPKHLSGGELKRVAIARALINSPDYLIADEPTSDLDVQTTSEIMRLLKDIADRGTGILMVTHDTDVLNYGNRTFVMKAGVLSERRGHDPRLPERLKHRRRLTAGNTGHHIYSAP